MFLEVVYDSLRRRAYFSKVKSLTAHRKEEELVERLKEVCRWLVYGTQDRLPIVRKFP